MSAYAAYLKATSAERTAILSKVIIIDAAPTVADLDSELREEVYWAARKEHHAAFLDRLEGWWLRRVLRQLTDATQDRVGSVELEAQISDLREQFKQDALPIDEDLLEFTLDEATKVKAEGFPRFGMSHHTDLWKSRDAKSNSKPYGVQIAKTWYWYDTWLAEVRKHCNENVEAVR